MAGHVVFTLTKGNRIARVLQDETQNVVQGYRLRCDEAWQPLAVFPRGDEAGAGKCAADFVNEPPEGDPSYDVVTRRFARGEL